jgi:hypothetical protein
VLTSIVAHHFCIALGALIIYSEFLYLVYRVFPPSSLLSTENYHYMESLQALLHTVCSYVLQYVLFCVITYLVVTLAGRNLQELLLPRNGTCIHLLCTMYS